MGKVKRLPQNVIQHIAAGEVVERPASVVKELIENSIDAGAKHIYVNIVAGGKKKIEVRDDGIGIEVDDVPIIFERYTTSKIEDVDDLYSISTLGFRGEALSSIALVSKVILETSTGGNGIRYVIEGGKERSSELVTLPKGTRISVENLFYNLPARRKFLKSDAYERNLALDWVRRYALIYPEISFIVEADEEHIFVTPGNGNLREVAEVIFEKPIEPVYLNYSSPPILIKGLLDRGRLYPDRKREILSINGRVIRSHILQKVIEDVTSKVIGDKGFPFIILDLRLPSNFIDVNIHPAKLEIKILDEGRVYSEIYNAIYNTVLGKKITYTEAKTEESVPQVVKDEDIVTYEQKVLIPEVEEREEDIFPLEPLGQYLNTFIVCTSSKGIYLVDQHVAHERILFDSFGEIKSLPQFLLEPKSVELYNVPYEFIEFIVNSLNQIGFECDIGGPDSIVIRAIPSFLKGVDIETALNDFLESKDFDINNLKREIACKSAVKLGDRLSIDEMRELMGNLSKIKNYKFCPHGRPIIIELIDRDSAFKKFGR
ncbi:MAG: DNA mismatch repair endonuclease MutL [bacterium]|nr:DNA mismatch repair endonuclease MutL [bacterium]